MKLVSFATASGGRGFGRVEGERVEQLGSGDLSQAVAEGVQLASMGSQQSHLLKELKLLPPLGRPSKIIAVALNYADHAREQNKEPPSSPIVFGKAPSCLIGPGDSIHLPGPDREIDVEVELVAVVGRRLTGVGAQEALDSMLGYTVGNDVSDREAQRLDKQNYRAKSYDSFGPLGPWIDTEFRPQDQPIRLYRNGQLQQDSRLDQLIFPVGELVSRLSSWQTLMPGDLIFTGTPPGVGAHRKPPVWLQPGDVIRCEIEGLGWLENPVR